MSPPTLLWFRQDLRVNDNPALTAALAAGSTVGLYVFDEAETPRWARGSASAWWLVQSLRALARDLALLGVPLILRRGASQAVVTDVARALGTSLVAWSRRIEPAIAARDDALRATLNKMGIRVDIHPGSTLFPPETIRKADGTPYTLYAPFWRACLAQPAPDRPLPAPKRVVAAVASPAASLASDGIEDWGLERKCGARAHSLAAAWTPGESEARARLARFLDNGLAAYATRRDRAEPDVTSGLSAALHFGEISPRTIWHSVREAVQRNPLSAASAQKFLSELGWREFAYHLLERTPQLPDEPLRAAFARFPWRDDRRSFEAWSQGRTGYPIVDAAMRALWQTGFIPNRARMIVASFLVKHLLIPWQQGEAWFWDTLVDADLANNALNWQWVAGTGIDSAPYVRVFNPVLQGETLDPDGHYVRRFVPELAALPTRFIHQPWLASASDLASAGVTLGATYPRPLIDHKEARARALMAYAHVKGAHETTELQRRQAG